MRLTALGVRERQRVTQSQRPRALHGPRPCAHQVQVLQHRVVLRLRLGPLPSDPAGDRPLGGVCGLPGSEIRSRRAAGKTPSATGPHKVAVCKAARGRMAGMLQLRGEEACAPGPHSVAGRSQQCRAKAGRDAKARHRQSRYAWRAGFASAVRAARGPEDFRAVQQPQCQGLPVRQLRVQTG